MARVIAWLLVVALVALVGFNLTFFVARPGQLGWEEGRTLVMVRTANTRFFDSVFDYCFRQDIVNDIACGLSLLALMHEARVIATLPYSEYAARQAQHW